MNRKSTKPNVNPTDTSMELHRTWNNWKKNLTYQPTKKSKGTIYPTIQPSDQTIVKKFIQPASQSSSIKISIHLTKIQPVDSSITTNSQPIIKQLNCLVKCMESTSTHQINITTIFSPTINWYNTKRLIKGSHSDQQANHINNRFDFDHSNLNKHSVIVIIQPFITALVEKESYFLILISPKFVYFEQLNDNRPVPSHKLTKLGIAIIRRVNNPLIVWALYVIAEIHTADGLVPLTHIFQTFQCHHNHQYITVDRMV